MSLSTRILLIAVMLFTLVGPAFAAADECCPEDTAYSSVLLHSAEESGPCDCCAEGQDHCVCHRVGLTFTILAFSTLLKTESDSGFFNAAMSAPKPVFLSGIKRPPIA